jgi:hypothetical protein
MGLPIDENGLIELILNYFEIWKFF